jgi:hypothetical protein
LLPLYRDCFEIEERVVQRRSAVLTIAAVLGVLVLASGLRAATLTADLPYQTYYDEPYTLTGSARQIAEGTWDPGVASPSSTKANSYLYPSFLIDATAVSATALAAVRGESAELHDGVRVTIESPYIEVVEPRVLVLAGRLVVLTLAIATVMLVALLGTQLGDRRVGILAAFFVAVLPVFVTRGSIVIVDTPAACFATAALYCAARVVSAPRRRSLMTWVVLAGVASGLAFTSKYTMATVLLGRPPRTGPAPRRIGRYATWTTCCPR